MGKSGKSSRRESGQSGDMNRLREMEAHIHVVEPFDQDNTEWCILTKRKVSEWFGKNI